jgi:ABC-type polysaccharide/polyol phosphate export permease
MVQYDYVGHRTMRRSEMRSTFLERLPLAFLLGAHDIRQAYRRSVVGPFWITAGMALQIATIGLVFGVLFKTSIQDYLPYLAVSIIIWGFMSGVINEACLAFISAENIIKQTDVPLFVYVFRLLWKNILVFGHHLVILPVVFLIVWRDINWNLIFVVPGFFLILLNLAWISFVLASISARYRDLPPIVTSLTGIAFYITPVMWTPELLGDVETQHLLLGLNPFYHFLQIVRLPILGQSPTLENWAISLLIAGIGWLAAYLVYRRFAKMIAYWV